MAWRTDTSIRFIGVCLLAVAGLATAGVILGSMQDSGPAEPTEPIEPEATCPDAAGSIGVLRDCLEPLLVLVETPVGAGTGVVLESGEIVTNAHVVNPFGAVDVTFTDGETVSDVGVLGLDIVNDIALLEAPRSTDRGFAVPDSTSEPIEDEEDVFLVGFPGATETDQPRVALTRGVVSRLRDAGPFDRAVVQSDAAITAGQSGGALVDGDGQLLGISGAGFNDVMSFSLAAGDVAASIDTIQNDGGSGVEFFPADGEGSTEPIEFDVTRAFDFRDWAVARSSEHRDLVVSIDGPDAFTLVITSVTGEVIGSYSGIDAPAFDLDSFGTGANADSSIGWFNVVGALNDPEVVVEPTDDGTFTFPIEPGTDVIVSLTSEVLGDFKIELSEPWRQLNTLNDGPELEVGDSVIGEIGGLSSQNIHAVELTTGDEIEIAATSSLEALSVSLIPPTEDPEQAAQDALFGLFAGYSNEIWEPTTSNTFAINRSGTFYVLVGSPSIGGYELSIVER